MHHFRMPHSKIEKKRSSPAFGYCPEYLLLRANFSFHSS
jgi:hypothetical protein